MESKNKQSILYTEWCLNLTYLVAILCHMFSAITTTSIYLRISYLILIGLLLTMRYFHGVRSKKASERISDIEYILDKIDEEIDKLEKENERD